MSLIDELQEVLKQQMTKQELIPVEDACLKRLPTMDPIIDRLVFGGGIPFGCFAMFTGHPGSFKTTFGACIGALLRKHHSNNIMVVYLDSEGSTTQQRLAMLGLTGVTPFVGVTIEKVNGVINTIGKLKRDNPKYKDIHFLVIWDSIASTPTEAELNVDDINKVIGLKSRILSFYLPKWINSVLLKYGVTIIAINQLRDKVGMGMMAPSTTLKNLSYDKTLPGGNAVLFLSNIILEHKVKQTFEDSTSPYGIRAYLVEIKSVKNKFFVDNLRLNLVFSPVLGYLPEFSQFELLKQLKFVVSSGGYWRSTIPEIDIKFRLKELAEKISHDESFKKTWDLLVEKAVSTVESNCMKGVVLDSDNGNGDENDIVEQVDQP